MADENEDLLKRMTAFVKENGIVDFIIFGVMKEEDGFSFGMGSTERISFVMKDALINDDDVFRFVSESVECARKERIKRNPNIN
jgi:hypothetical protein